MWHPSLPSRFVALAGGGAIAVLATASAFGPLAARAQPPRPALVPESFRDRIPLLSGAPMLLAAKSLGVGEVLGKDLTRPAGPPGRSRARKLRDVGIGVHPVVHENEPTVAANPRDKKHLVAGSHYIDPDSFSSPCVAFSSGDRGASWSEPIPLPLLTASSICSDPVLAYAPDGSRVYFAYMDIKDSDWDIVVSFSDDDGRSWTGPIIALDSGPELFLYDKPWIGTHVDPAERAWVYVTATRFDLFGFGDCHIHFTRSGNRAESWTGPLRLDGSSGGCDPVVQGSRPAGGRGGDVLVAWYHSGFDGWLEGAFQIRTRRSANHGGSFGPRVVAAEDSFEAPFWLGPLAFYHRWWATMFPDVEVDPGGAAHIVYTHDPVENFFGLSETPEDGDVRYVSSPGPPYGSWSSPITLNDDGLERAQGFAAIETQHGGRSSSLHALWNDHRLTPDLPIEYPSSPNLRYDVFYSRKAPGRGVGWFQNFRVSERSSINDYVFIGDYNDLAAQDTTLFGVWTDRRDQSSIFSFEDDVFGSRIGAGGGAPK